MLKWPRILTRLVTAWQAALQNEVRAERMKSELITNVSHDLKTPLTSILNYSDLLGKMDLTPEEANDYARIIYQKGLRLKKSDERPVRYLQGAVGRRADHQRTAGCVHARPAGARGAGQGRAGERLDRQSRHSRAGAAIWADGRKLSRVLENLIGNCVKYALKGTRVFLSVAEENGRAIIELKNTANYEMDFAAMRSPNGLSAVTRRVRPRAAVWVSPSRKAIPRPAAARSMSRWTAISLRCVSAFQCTV